MAREPKKLDDLFHDTLKDIYFAEKKILTALPKMAKAAHSEELRAAFEKHYGETEGQVERLERVFDLIGRKAQGKTCDAIIGLVEEGQEVMKEYKGSPALDAGLLAGAQAVQSYANPEAVQFLMDALRLETALPASYLASADDARRAPETRHLRALRKARRARWDIAPGRTRAARRTPAAPGRCAPRRTSAGPACASHR